MLSYSKVFAHLIDNFKLIGIILRNELFCIRHVNVQFTLDMCLGLKTGTLFIRQPND